MAGDLYRQAAGAAGGAQDEHLLPGAKHGAMAQREPRRHARVRRGEYHRIRPRRQVDATARVDRHTLGHGPEAGVGQHEVDERAVVATAHSVDALAQLSFVVQLTLTKVAGAHDLSLTQLRLLGILVDRTLAMAELASYLGLDRSTARASADSSTARRCEAWSNGSVGGKTGAVYRCASPPRVWPWLTASAPT